MFLKPAHTICMVHEHTCPAGYLSGNKKKKKKRDKGEKIRENEGTVAESNENAQKKKKNPIPREIRYP